MPSKNTTLATKKPFEYKWVILVVCFLMVFVCLGFCSSTKSLYLGAITEYLNIPRSLFAINDTCRFVSSAIINLFFGTLMYKYGVRKMSAVGFLALIASTLIYAFATNIYVFYIGGALLGVGVTFTVSKFLWQPKNALTPLCIWDHSAACQSVPPLAWRH